MDISLRINKHRWESVYAIDMQTPLIKGRHGFYAQLIHKAGQRKERFGCYAWGSSPDNLFYIGSFSKDYKRGNFKNNLQARIHNYLQNHRRNENGRINTNLMVFEKIGSALLTQDVTLYLFAFDFLTIGQDKIGYADYCENGKLVRTVEHLLIYSYGIQTPDFWNRE